MRGRGDKGGTEQRLEINYSKAINAITTVQKDTMILEKTLDEKEKAEIIPNGTERNGTERQNYCYRESESGEGLSGQSEGIKPLRNLSINQGNGLQRSTEDYHRIAVICCKLNKMPTGKLGSLNDAEICDLYTQTSSTVTARYYKGLGAHKDNMVMEIWKK